jgi:hypothetical protein
MAGTVSQAGSRAGSRLERCADRSTPRARRTLSMSCIFSRTRLHCAFEVTTWRMDPANNACGRRPALFAKWTHSHSRWSRCSRNEKPELRKSSRISSSLAVGSVRKVPNCIFLKRTPWSTPFASKPPPAEGNPHTS